MADFSTGDSDQIWIQEAVAGVAAALGFVGPWIILQAMKQEDGIFLRKDGSKEKKK